MHNPLRALAGLGRALGYGCDDGGGSTRMASPACVRSAVLVLGSGCKRGVGVCAVQVQAKERCERHCRRLATTRLQRGRRRSAGGRRSGT
jgi:hypothetical protein